MISRRCIGLIAVVTPLWFLVVYLVMAGLRPEYSYLTKAVSELGSVHASHKWFWNVLGYILPGLAVALLGFGLKLEFSDTHRYAWVPSLAVVASGLFMAMSGVFPGDFVNRTATTMVLHTVGSMGSGLAFMVAVVWLPAFFRKSVSWRWLAWPSLALVIVLIGVALLMVPRTTPGLAQRVTFASFFLWIGIVGYALFRSTATKVGVASSGIPS